MKQLLIILTGIFLIISCSGSKDVLQKKSNDSGAGLSEMDTLELAENYISLGTKAEQIYDTLGAEYYYSKAMDLTGDYQKSHDQPVDSLANRRIQNISLEYARFLARLNGIEHDTLSAANVMKVISGFEDSLATGRSDSTLITIPDIIEDDEVMAVPLVLNRKVEQAMQYFQGKGRKVYTKWLQRTGWYKPLITRILREEGVPQELFYLAMIESGFNPSARSYARAVGIWQFISATGRAYGLKHSWWFDERRDPEKATRAAARHLKDLYERFNSNWYLAIAGYNYSPGKIERRLRRYKVDEFWDLPKLPRQTRNYVPTFIAAALLAKEPEKYGFYVEPEEPVVFDTITVRECVDLNVVADCVEGSFDQLKKLNPALLRWCTPPDVDSWILNIPLGSRDKFVENYAKVPDKNKLTWVHHRIRSGETLSTIARRYGVSMSEIKRFNKIRGSLIRAGHHLVIPVPQNKKYAARIAKRSTSSYSSYRPKSKPVSNVPGKNKKIHTVRKGETLWELAIRYGVTITQIRKWNGLGYTRIIKPGQRLNIWLSPGHDLLAHNNSSDSGDKEVVNPGAKKGSQNTVYYTVRRGDTLWDIAAQYGISIAEIKRWNNRRSNMIKPGEQLKIIIQQ